LDAVSKFDAQSTWCSAVNFSYFTVSYRSTANPDLGLVRDRPRALAKVAARLLDGRPVKSFITDDVVLRLDPDFPGLGLGGFISNLSSCLFFHRAIAQVLRGQDEPPSTEIIPVSILDQRGRPGSRDYVLVHPLGSIDCLDDERTKARRHDDGSIVHLEPEDVVLRSGSIPPDRILFRIAKYPRMCVFRSDALAAIKAIPFPDHNMLLTKLECQ
jgi:hypothetical protein